MRPGSVQASPRQIRVSRVVLLKFCQELLSVMCQFFREIPVKRLVDWVLT